MYGYISGYSETSIINYCPACGEEIAETFGDGTGKCSVCGMRFAVIEVDDENEELEE
jgi:uncharacterized Zn finger protein (UPF0148 family)